ncbi:MAG: winged helix-turn-helix transcriptional regulator [Methanosarcinales archaeon]|nr:winged helix-turn-helix transcriptional regulator [Methanosarcinales archaeon]
MRRVIWWLLVGTKGGLNRARIIRALKERPYNANQLAEVLGLDYKTVRHHLKVLQDNKLLTPVGDGYGTVYFLSPSMEGEYEVFEDFLDKIWAKFKAKKDIV